MSSLGSHAEEHSSANDREGYVVAFRGKLSAESPSSAGMMKSDGNPSPEVLQRVLDGLREL